MATVLHFTEIDGNREYVIVTEDDPTDKNIKDQTVPGFKLNSKSVWDDVPATFPTERELWVK